MIQDYLSNNINKSDIVMNDFHSIRNLYCEKRQYGWYIIQDILRIDMDESHSWHSQATHLTDELVNRFANISLFSL